MRLLGHSIAAQWYCPPADGYALRNSARLDARHRLHTPAVIKPQRTEVGPPLGKARDRDVASAVQEFRMANAKPSIASGENVRFNSWVCPRAARCSASSEMPPPVMIAGGVVADACSSPALSSSSSLWYFRGVYSERTRLTRTQNRGSRRSFKRQRVPILPLQLTKDSRPRRTVAPEVLNFCYHTKTDVMGHLEIIARADMRSGTRPPHLEQSFATA